MKVIYGIENYDTTEYKSSVALGFFDGVHLGHKEVINSCVNNNSDYKSIVLTFKDSPAKSFGANVEYLNTQEEKIEEIEKLGVDYLIFCDFDKIKDYSPESFVDEILNKKLKAKNVFCGFNYHFGKGGKGNSTILHELAEHLSINSFVIEPVIFKDRNVSSTRIRNCIKDGEIKDVSTMLSYNYSISGIIKSGNKLGRELHAPTINIDINKEKVLPRLGVYKTKVTIDEKEYIGATNIGEHPTVGKVDPICETYLLNYTGDNLYEKTAKIELLDFIRDEIKFNNKDDLQKQIKEDIKKIKGLL